MNLHGNPNVNRDHLITWPSGQPVHAALRDLLLESWDRTGNRYDVTHGRLAWQADGGVLLLGRGVAGRWEVAVEVNDDRRGESPP